MKKFAKEFRSKYENEFNSQGIDLDLLTEYMCFLISPVYWKKSHGGMPSVVPVADFNQVIYNYTVRGMDELLRDRVF